MPDSLEPVDLSFIKTASHLEYANRYHAFVDALAVHPGFQVPFPPPVPDSKELKGGGDQFTSVMTEAATTGSRIAAAQRDELRPKTAVLMTMTVQWVVMRAIRENDPSLLANLTLEPKKKRAPRTTTPSLVDAPEKVKVKHGPLSGTVLLVISAVNGAVSHQVEYCQGVPAGEDSWTFGGDQRYCKMTIKGLEPGKVYYFRVRSFGAAGHGPWSEPVSIMVI